MHDSKKPFVKSGKLLNEVGKIQLHRVSEETKEKVREDTKRVNEYNRVFLIKSKTRIQKQETERLKATAEARQAMTDKWVCMTKASPYHNNLVKLEEKRAAHADNVQRVKEEDRFIQKTLDDMTGKPKFEIMPKEKIHKSDFDLVSQVALEYRLQKRAKTVVMREKEFVDGMVHQELSKLHKKFPAVLKPPSEGELYPNTIPL